MALISQPFDIEYGHLRIASAVEIFEDIEDFVDFAEVGKNRHSRILIARIGRPWI